MSVTQAEFMQQILDYLARVEQRWPQPAPALDWHQVMAARWMPGQSPAPGWLRPLQVRLDLQLNDLHGIERQKLLLNSNTAQFVAGYPANNALLWGARGTGKSSLVRALLARYASQGMRLIEIDKADLLHLPELLQQIADQPWRFVLFCDDLAFEADDAAYKSLKTVLDGTAEASPDNLLLYATSNRRHLLPEKRSDNLAAELVDGEIHPGEAVEEKVALSDRFGLWVSFYPFSQDQYLTVVQHWLGLLAAQYQLNWEWTPALQQEAIRWATTRGNRNGRCAWQFARAWVGRALLPGGD
ncbi:MAG: ATP-binding protein [Pseudomonadaceae bacterium]|nr:MAG: ATP-binding protein [Pseudomonadaceae bacterium]